MKLVEPVLILYSAMVRLLRSCLPSNNRVCLSTVIESLIPPEIDLGFSLVVKVVLGISSFFIEQIDLFRFCFEARLCIKPSIRMDSSLKKHIRSVLHSCSVRFLFGNIVPLPLKDNVNHHLSKIINWTDNMGW
ncbi:unnamed protein product [Thlaspi arvense]|uniref:Uncharacterized protein n=1 Tax=Thlaspi arvense TaxID=13288 RepID=A0AAU9RMY0_THLAR|nr:unnamed protein product [Thlaspi arvense]